MLQRLRYLGSLAASRLLGSRRLFSLSLCVTNRCNLKCVYCYGDYFYRKEQDMPLEHVLSVIDGARGLGLRHLYLTGGEPLLRKDIGSIVDHAKRHDLITGMVSNGFFVKRKIDEIRALDKIILSLDGRREVNDLNRGSNSYDRTMEAIDTCVRHKLDFDLKMVLNRVSRDQLPWMLELCEKLGCQLEVVFAYAPRSDIQKGKHTMNMLDFSERASLAEELHRLKREGRPLMFSSGVYGKIAGWNRQHPSDMVAEQEKQPGFPYTPCYAGRYFCFIDGDGLMYPCNQLIGEYPAKSAVADFDAAWEAVARKGCAACNVYFLTQANDSFDLHLTSMKRILRKG